MNIYDMLSHCLCLNVQFMMMILGDLPIVMAEIMKIYRILTVIVDLLCITIRSHISAIIINSFSIFCDIPRYYCTSTQ